MKDFYQLSAEAMNAQEISMEKFRGKVVLIVNTASKCGFTPQFQGLEDLYKEYKEEGLEILGFPCNQFSNQDPNSNKEIEEFCQINYGVSFTMFKKIEVNGENTHPIFSFLKSQKGGILGDAIKWNFTKFLINREGDVVDRFAPITNPKDLKSPIKNLL